MIYFSHLIDFFRWWGKKGILEECMYQKYGICKTKKEILKKKILANLLRGRIKHYPLNISYIFLQNSSSQKDK